MATERVIEVPWALMQIPQAGTILDVGSCDATYLHIVQQADRILHCLDPRDPSESVTSIPPGAVFLKESIIGNTLPRAHYDAVLLISVVEHIGLPCYGQRPFPLGDRLTLAEIWALLKPGCPLIATVPVGQSKIVSWYRQYTPATLHSLFKGWQVEISYWGFNDERYQMITEQDVDNYDYRDYNRVGAGAGAFAGIVAYRP